MLYIIPRATVYNTATCLGICRVRIFKAYHYGDNLNFQLALRRCLLFSKDADGSMWFHQYCGVQFIELLSSFSFTVKIWMGTLHVKLLKNLTQILEFAQFSWSCFRRQFFLGFSGKILTSAPAERWMLFRVGRAKNVTLTNYQLKISNNSVYHTKP